MEILSGKKRSPTMPKLQKQSPRPDHFKPVDPHLPDSHVYHTEELLNVTRGKHQKDSKNLGALKFNKRPIRDMDSPPKFRSPGMYDHDKIERGMKALSKTKNIKG